MSQATNKTASNKRKQKQKHQDQDSPWKKVLGNIFDPFLAFHFPILHRTIDWERGYEQLDTELARLKRNSATGKRVVDKLVKVFLLDGQEQWILIHVEVQSYRDQTFAERMFIYNYLLRHRFKRPIESLAILTDSNRKFRPQSYQEKLTITETNFTFGMVKLLDYQSHWAELESDANPFALVTMAWLKALELKGPAKDQLRLEWKVQLVNLLEARRLSIAIADAIFEFIDWIMVLPDDMELDFQERLAKGKILMPYVSSLERVFTRKGLEQGRQEGTLGVVLRLLNKRFGPLESNLEQQISELDITGLDKLSDNLLDFTSKADVDNWLAANKNETVTTDSK